MFDHHLELKNTHNTSQSFMLPRKPPLGDPPDPLFSDGPILVCLYHQTPSGVADFKLDDIKVCGVATEVPRWAAAAFLSQVS